MAQRRHHYEHAFEAYLRERRVPYVAVDEARKALIPEGEALQVSVRDAGGEETKAALKSFDFVIYGQGTNLLVEVKGRKLARRALKSASRGRLESWVTAEDIESLTAWGRLFGPEFTSTFIFIYWCDEQPPDALFEEVIEHRGRWYALRAISLADYRSAMKLRSQRWGTVDLPRAAYDRLSVPFTWPMSGKGDAPPSAPAFEPIESRVG